MVRQIAVMVERTCDNCGKVVAFNDMDVKAQERMELTRWFAVARETWDNSSQVLRTVQHCCSVDCVKQLVAADPAISFPQGAAN